jgi:hypothetical protein
MLASALLVSREENGFQILKNQITLYGAPQAELASVIIQSQFYRYDTSSTTATSADQTAANVLL